MPWHLFLLVISVCLIQDIQSSPESNAFGNKSDSGLDDLQNLCEKCQVLEVPNLLEKYAVVTLEKTCRKDRTHQDFCSQIQGAARQFLDFNDYNDFNHAKEKELCSNLSVCDPSQNDWIWKKKPLSTCEQCRWTMVGLTDEMNDPTHELPYERLQYRTKKTADLLKEVCHDTFARKYFSGFCALIDGRESEVVKSAFDCTGLEFKGRESKLNCTAKACKSFVESCKDDNFLWPSFSTCEQCEMAVNKVAKELISRTGSKQTADLLKEACRDSFTRKYFSDFCTLIEGKESEIVKTTFDCSRNYFKDQVEMKCAPKVCARFVESCKDDQFPLPSED